MEVLWLCLMGGGMACGCLGAVTGFSGLHVEGVSWCAWPCVLVAGLFSQEP